MKTAMQELIEELNKLYNFNYGGEASGIRIAIDIAMNQFRSIEKEKQQIIDAWNAGYDGCDSDHRSGLSPEKYYNEVFHKEPDVQVSDTTMMPKDEKADKK
jgi:uncharacterized protein YggL (DUF469 family)